MSKPVAVITGGSSGIGLAITEKFLGNGYRVAVFSRGNTEVALKNSHSVDDVMLFTGDVGCSATLARFYDDCYRLWGRIDVVVANAGVARAESIEEVTEQSFDSAVNINLKGVFFTVQKALPYVSRGASMVLISSIQAQRGAGIWSVYGATKAAVRSLVRSFAQAFGDEGIRVNALSPGVTNTPILEKFGLPQSELSQVLAQVAANTPLGRIAEPREIANAVFFLASDEASFITGCDLQVDGGLAQI